RGGGVPRPAHLHVPGLCGLPVAAAPGRRGVRPRPDHRRPRLTPGGGPARRPRLRRLPRAHGGLPEGGARRAGMDRGSGVGGGRSPRLAVRAAELLARPGAWLEADGDGWVVRLGGDRRRRPALRLGEAAHTALVAAYGLARRAGGGWRLARGADAGVPAARPGVIPGAREVVEADGLRVLRAANL